MPKVRIVAALVLFAVLAAVVEAGRVGVVVQYNDSSVEAACVQFSGEPSAYDVLGSSRFSMATADFPPFGPALCGIDGVGCPASNCFCDSKYWGFYYKRDGGWQYSNVGIGFAQDSDGYQIARDGGMIGFRWGSWGQMPASKSFDEVCPPERAAGARSEDRVHSLNLVVGVNCSGNVTVETSDEEGRIIPFAEVHVTRPVLLLVFDKVGVVVTDGEGRGAIRVGEGRFFFEAMSPEYLPKRVEVEVEPCAAAEPVPEALPEMPAQAGKPAAELLQPIVKVLERGDSTGWDWSGWTHTGWLGRRPR